MSQLTIVALIRAKAGLSEDLGKQLAALVAPSRQEAGNINYDVHRSNDDANLWCVYENWRSAAALDEHFATPHMQAFVAALPPLVEGELDIRRFTMTSTPA